MAKIDEKMLQMVVEMATQGGKMEAQHEAQERDLVNLRAEVQRLQVMIEKRDARISELETLLSQQQSAHPTVVVNQYFMLSVPLTRDYVSNLSNDGRQFVGHMLHQTMPAETPRYMLDQMDEITQLKGSREERLADAMEELARKPTTQNNYGDYVEGDKVKEKTTIPNVSNYQPQITTQNMEVPMTPFGQGEPKQLRDE